MDFSEITLGVALWAGFLSFFSPCVLPLAPSYVVYITGLSFNELRDEHTTKTKLTALIHSSAFVAGFSIVFVALGAMAGMAAEHQDSLRHVIDWTVKVAGIVVLIFGLHLVGIFKIKLLLGEKRFNIQKKPAGILGTGLVGMAFAAGWTPCIGPILGTILTMAAGFEDGSTSKGVMMLGVFSVGLGAPFILTALLFDKFLSFFNKFKKYIRAVEVTSGALLICIGALIIFDKFQMLGGYLMRLAY